MRVLLFVLSACWVAAGSAASAFADTYTYTYTGQQYQFAHGAYTTSERVTGEVTLGSALGANVVFNPVSPPTLDVLSFNFSDGVQTLTNTSAGLTDHSFEFGTDAAGLPTRWGVNLYQTVLYGYAFGVPEYGFNQIETVSETNFQQDVVFNGYNPRGGSGWLGENTGTPGSWTLTVNATPSVPAAATPEPGSIGLVASGVLGLAGCLRRRVAG